MDGWFFAAAAQASTNTPPAGLFAFPGPPPRGAQRPLIVSSDVLLAAAFPTATATGTRAIWDRLWPGLAGL